MRFISYTVIIYFITLTLGLYLVYLMGDNIYKNRELEFKLHAMNAMNSIRAQFFERQADVKAFSLNRSLLLPIITKNRETIQEARSTLQKLHDIYLVYPISVVTDPSGNIIYQYLSDKDKRYKLNVQSLSIKESTLLNKDIFFRDFSNSPELSLASSNFSDLQKFISPFFKSNGEVAGYIINYADDLYLKREFLQIKEYFHQLALSDVDFYLASTDQKFILGYCEGRFANNCKKAKHVVTSKSGVKIFNDELVAWQKLEDNRLIAAPDWTMVLNIKKSTYFRSIDKLMTIAFAATFLVITLCFFAIIFNYQHKFKTEKMVRKKIIETQESERQRIAREIHDELGQNLTAIKFHLESDKNDSVESLQNKLSEVKSVIDYTNDSVRRISHELHPSLIKNLGLVAAIQWTLTKTLESKGKHYQLNISAEDKNRILSSSVQFQSHLYRIIQESLNNFLKHSNGNLFSISFFGSNRHLKIMLEDNGQFQSRPYESKSHKLGLHTIEERVKILNGSVRFGSSSSLNGFGIEVQVPWEKREQSPK